MVSLLSMLFLVVTAYFIDRREKILLKNKHYSIRKLFKVLFVVVAVCTFIMIQPAWIGSTYLFDAGSIKNPLGLMIYKFYALITLGIVGGVLVVIDLVYLRDKNEEEWGKLNNSSRNELIVAGVVGTWLVSVMGYVRESARSPWLVSSVIPIPGMSSHPTPLQIQSIFAVWGIITALTLIIFWFTSRVTAHHPEKAEKMD